MFTAGSLFGPKRQIIRCVVGLFLAWACPEEGEAANDFATWQNLHGVGAFHEDNDRDGLPNGIEYLLGTLPQDPNAENGAMAAQGIGWTEGDEGSRLTLRFRVVGNAPSDATLRVQVSDDLDTWITVARRLTTGEWTGDAQLITEPAIGGRIPVTIIDPRSARSVARRFFRLHGALSGPDQAPTAGDIMAPASAVRGETVEVRFDFADANSDIRNLLLTRTDALGTTNAVLNAELAGVSGAAGQGMLRINTAVLPFGVAEFSLILQDESGLESRQISFAIAVRGLAGGGSPPVIDAFAPAAASYGRPVGQLDRGRVEFLTSISDPERDLAVLRVRITDPGGNVTVAEESPSALGLTPAGGNARPALVVFRHDSIPGEYAVELTPFDRNGNAGAPVTTNVSLLAFGGAVPALALYSTFPNSGTPGTEISISGQGFSTAPGAETLFQIGETPCALLSLTEFTAQVRIPFGARTAPLTAVNPDGSTAVASQNFLVPEHILLAPAGDEGPLAVAVNGTIPFNARVGSGRADQTITWRVNGIAGGTEEIGTISSSGLYRAPRILPAQGVQVSATLAGDAAVTSAPATIVIRPPPATPGATPLLASLGGTASSEDFQTSVNVPPEALASDTTISARTLSFGDLPLAGAGRRSLGGAQFGPSGTSFRRPVTVTIPLVTARAPGTLLRLRFFQPATGTFIDEGIAAQVNGDGTAATAEISHFSIAVLDEALPGNLPLTAPEIGRIEPAEVEENARQPLRIAGRGLTGDLRVEMRNADGSLAGGMRPQTLVATGDQAGFVLNTDAIRDLGAGAQRTYRVRLVRAHDDTLFAEVPLIVRGLPEFEVAAGETLELTNPAPLRVSVVNVGAGARVRLRSGTLALTSLGDIRIFGTIDARGRRGADGEHQSGGASGSTGGAGGHGRDDADNILGVHSPEPPSFGRHGNDPVGVVDEDYQAPARPLDALTREPRGLGGVPGANLDADLLVTSPFGIPGAVADLISGAFDVLNGNTSGRRGLGAPAQSAFPTTGGGGGAGGGRINVTAAGLADVFVLGGGGGGGGDGGAQVLLHTARSLIGPTALDSTHPIVDVRGGDGGHGSARSRLRVSILFDAITLYEDSDSPALTGGGGGGGRSGIVQVSAAEGLFLDSEAGRLAAGPGKGGIGGVTVIDVENSRTSEEVRDNMASDGESFRRARSVAAPAFHPGAFHAQVLTRSILRLQSPAGPDIGPLRFTIQGEQPGQQLTVVAQHDPAKNRYEATAVLFSGFNTLADPGVALRDPLAAPRLLVLATDTDGDGLTDDDETDLGTNPNDPDSDDDGLADGQEIAFRSNPLAGDTDQDGLSDRSELAANTNPQDADTDGDGFFDSAEVLLNSDARSATSQPLELPAGHLLANSGGFLAAVNPADGRDLALLGRPNGGLGFGLAFDEFATLYTANLTTLAIYDPLAQTSTPVGEFGTIGGTTIRCLTLAFNPADRWLYGIELGPSPGFAPTGQLLRINPLTGAAVRVGPPGAAALHTLVFTREGRLFATTVDPATGMARLVELDPANGMVMQTIGATQTGPVAGLAITRAGAVFAAGTHGNQTSFLHTIDLGSGLATPAVPVARPLGDLTIKPRPAPALSAPIVSAGAQPDGFDFSSTFSDLNGDGHVDAAVVWSAGTFPHDLTIRRGDGSGAFTETARFRLPGLRSEIGTVTGAGDVTGDGRPDIFANNPEFSSQGSARIILTIANPAAARGFDEPIAIGESAGLTQMIALVHLNPLDDAFLDIISGEALSEKTAVSFGNGAGAFPTSRILDGAPAVAAADMNGDGYIDLISAESLPPDGQAGIGLRFNDGHGGFTPTARFPSPLPGSLAPGDFDGDGRRDVAILGTRDSGNGGSQGELVIMRQDANGAFAVGGTLAIPGFPDRLLAVGDLTGDGRADAVCLIFDPQTFAPRLWVFAGRSDGTLHHGSSTPVAEGAYDLDLVDVNADGRLDVVLTGTGGVYTYLVEPSF